MNINTNKDRKTAAALILLALFAIGELVWVSVMLTRQLGKIDESTEISAGEQVVAWKTYSNDQCGLEFRYPETWSVHEFGQPGGGYSAYVSLGTYDKDWAPDQENKTSLGVIKMEKTDPTKPNELSEALFDGLEEIGIGQGESIKARKITGKTGSDEDVPLFSNKQIVSYYIPQSKRNGVPRCEINIAYLSDLGKKHLREFHQIIGTLRMF